MSAEGDKGEKSLGKWMPLKGQHTTDQVMWFKNTITGNPKEASYCSQNLKLHMFKITHYHGCAKSEHQCLWK
jgi:hypothetical protein